MAVGIHYFGAKLDQEGETSIEPDTNVQSFGFGSDLPQDLTNITI